MSKRKFAPPEPRDSKYIDTFNLWPFLAFQDTPFPIYLNIVKPGSGQNERLGNKIRLTRVRLRMRLSIGTPDSILPITPLPNIPYLGRIILFLDRACNGSVNGAGAPIVLEALTTDFPLYNEMLFQNMANADRIQIIKDQSFLLPTAGSAGTDFPDGSVTFGGLPVLTTVAAADIMVNEITLSLDGVTQAPKYAKYPNPPFAPNYDGSGTMVGQLVAVEGGLTTARTIFNTLTANISFSGGTIPGKGVFSTAELQRFLWEWDLDLTQWGGNVETVFNSNDLGVKADINTNALCLFLFQSFPQSLLHDYNYTMVVSSRVYYDD